MKIFHLIQKPQLRGAEMFASQLGNHLLQKGHECSLISIFEGKSILPFNGRHVQLGRPLKRRLFDIRGWKNLAEIIKKEKPDIIQANAGDTLKYAVSSKYVFGWNVPIVFRNANKIGDFIDSRLKLMLNGFFLAGVDHVVSVSELCRKDFIRTFDFDTNKISTIPVGIDHVDVPDFPKDIKNLFGAGPVLCNVAGLVREKNHHGLLRIFATVHARLPHSQLLIIGSGPLLSELVAYSKSLNVGHAVHFLGNRTDVLSIIKASSVFLLSSRIEGLPAVLLEAMYCKTPVIAYDVGGISEVVIQGETGHLICKDDELEFAKAAVDLLSNSPMKDGIVDRAYVNITSNFDNRFLSEQFLSVYQLVSKK